MREKPSSSSSSLPANVCSLVREAELLFERTFPDDDNDGGEGDEGRRNHLPLCISTAPGRVNLIGEHTDYTGGFVLPMAIGRSTVCYGRGTVVNFDDGGAEGGGASSSLSSSRHLCRVVSSNSGDDESPSVVSFLAVETLTPSLAPSEKWANYVMGVAKEYLRDLGPGEALTFDLAVAGDVPLGGGLSSSASLEVATAVFLESVFLKSRRSGPGDDDDDTVIMSREAKITRARRCQSAENNFCGAPCGIMDQFVSSAAVRGSFLLIDCRKVDFREVSLGRRRSRDEPNESDDEIPVIVIANSNVTHDIGGGEYPARVQQCREATNALAAFDPEIKSLRDAVPADVERAASDGTLDGILWRRARHVVTENARTTAAADALEGGDWVTVGRLMNESHASMRDDYEVSCDEIDILADYAQKFDGAYGSRLTGGGFGGCTVTLVRKDRAEALMEGLAAHYKEQTGGKMTCTCFETSPAAGARAIRR